MSMEQFISYIVKNLVDQPDDVQVSCTSEEDRMSVELRVADGDVARIIGRRGKTIQALRTVAMSAAARLGYRARLELIEEGKEEDSSAPQEAPSEEPPPEAAAAEDEVEAES